MENVLYVLVLGLAIVGKVVVFKKMDISCWKALVPIYSEYLLFKKLWDAEMFKATWFFMITSVIAFCIGFGLSLTGPSFIGLVFLVMSVLLDAIMVSIQVNLLHRLSLSFGHGIGYTFGLIFLQPIFIALLAFEKNQYCPLVA